MNINLKIIANYLIILMPALLISGPLLSDLSVVLIDLIFIYYLLKDRKFKYIDNLLFKVLFIYTFYISVRSIFTEEIFFSLKSSLPYFRFIILIFAIKYFLNENEKLISYFSKGIIITILILFIDAIFQFIFGFNLLGFKTLNPDKLNGLFGDEGVMGSYLIRFFPLLLACYVYLFKENSKFTFILLFFCISALIFLSGSRSSLALLFLFSFLFFLLFHDYRKKIIIVFLVLFGLISTIVVKDNLITAFKKEQISTFEFKSKISYRIYYNLFDPIKTIFTDVDTDKKNFEKENRFKNLIIFTKVYQSHYETAFKMYNQNKLFGVGNKMFRKLCSNEKYFINEFSCSTHPHNFYIQILAENGIIGFIFLISFFVYLIIILSREFITRNFKKIKYFDDISLLIFLGIFINLWPIVPSGNFFNNWLSILIYFPIGFFLYFREKNS